MEWRASKKGKPHSGHPIMPSRVEMLTIYPLASHPLSSSRGMGDISEKGESETMAQTEQIGHF